MPKTYFIRLELFFYEIEKFAECRLLFCLGFMRLLHARYFIMPSSHDYQL